MKYFKVVNQVKPHCTRCGKNYRVGETISICSEFYGKGADRIQCNGPVVKDSQLDWSYNLLKDYSIIKNGDLSLYDEVEKGIQKKLIEVKTGTSPDTGRMKVNVQSEIENAMRLRGINIINRFDSNGNLISKSVYILPAGESMISEYGYEELRERFEQVTTEDQTGKKLTMGYMLFEEMNNETDKHEETKVEVKQPDDLTCEVCGKTFKGKLGLIAHSKKHEKE